MSALTCWSIGLEPAARKPVIIFALLCGALFTGVIGTLGAIYVYELDPDQVSQELEWPSWMIYLCIPLGSYLMCFRFLQVAWRFRRSGYLPHHGHAHGIEYEGEPELPARGAGSMTSMAGTTARPRGRHALAATVMIALPLASR